MVSIVDLLVKRGDVLDHRYMQKSTKRGMSDVEAAECAALKRVWLAFKAREEDRGQRWTQESVAERLGWTQANFSHYVNGRQALNLNVLLAAANLFGVDPAEISPRLAATLPTGGDPMAEMVKDLPPEVRNAALDSLELALRRAQDSIFGDKFTQYMRMLDNLRNKPGSQ